jgi:hypothetical protein
VLVFVGSQELLNIRSACQIVVPGVGLVELCLGRIVMGHLSAL